MEHHLLKFQCNPSHIIGDMNGNIIKEIQRKSNWQKKIARRQKISASGKKRVDQARKDNFAGKKNAQPRQAKKN